LNALLAAEVRIIVESLNDGPQFYTEIVIETTLWTEFKAGDRFGPSTP
jgi:hypothetical protein